jgi:hypothetical protein
MYFTLYKIPKIPSGSGFSAVIEIRSGSFIITNLNHLIYNSIHVISITALKPDPFG